MPIKKKIINTQLIHPDWIRWMIICDEVAESKINIEEIHNFNCTISREETEAEKTTFPTDDCPDAKIVWDIQPEYTYHKILEDVYHSLCCRPFDSIPKISSSEKVQDEMVCFLHKMKDSTEKALCVIRNQDLKSQMNIVLSNCDKAIKLIENFKPHNENDFIEELGGTDCFDDIWDVLEDNGIKLKVGIGSKAENFSFSRPILNAWYRCETCYDPEFDSYGPFSVLIPKESGLFFYVFMCLFALDHAEYDGLKLGSKFYWDEYKEPSDSLWIKNLMEPSSPKVASWQEYNINAEDKEFLEKFLQRQSFDGIIHPEQLDLLLNDQSIISFNLRERLTFIKENRHQTLSRIYILLNKETAYLEDVGEKLSNQFFSSFEETRNRADNNAFWERCEMLETSISKQFLNSGKGNVNEVIEYEVLKPSFRFDGTPALNNYVVQDLIEKIISANKKISQSLFDKIQNEKNLEEVISPHDNQDSVPSQGDKVTEIRQKGLTVLLRYSIIAKDGEKYVSLTNGGKIVECLIQSSYFGINMNESPLKRNRRDNIKEIKNMSSEQIKSFIHFDLYDGLIRKKGKEEYFSSRELHDTFRKFTEKRISDLLKRLTVIIQEKERNNLPGEKKET